MYSKKNIVVNLRDKMVEVITNGGTEHDTDK
jgi:hypothetical protein